jgi:hypothetical protein
MRWGLDRAALARCTAVEVETPDPFVRQYVMLQLAHAGKAYYHAFPVITYFGRGTDLGRMRAIPTDCTIAPVERDGETRLVIRTRADAHGASRGEAGPR